MQRRTPRSELLGLTAADATSVVWTLDCDVVESAAGVDFKGPYIQGRPHERFIYLSWGSVDSAGGFNMFRRAKLWLDAIDADTLAAAIGTDRPAVARLGLTDAKGHPTLCRGAAAVDQWSAGKKP